MWENFKPEEELIEDLKTLLKEPKASETINYLEWTNVKITEINRNTGKTKQATTQRVPKVAKAKDLAVETLADLKVLKEHLERNHVIKHKVADKKEEVM